MGGISVSFYEKPKVYSKINRTIEKSKLIEGDKFYSENNWFGYHVIINANISSKAEINE